MSSRTELLSETNHLNLNGWVFFSIAFIITGLLIRGYEYIIVTENFLLPENAATLYIAGFLHDLLFFSLVSIIILPLYLIISRFNNTIACWFSITFLTAILITYLLIIQYFAEILVPLGSDFFAYNFTEISDTVHTSVTITIWRILPLILFPAIFICGFFLIRRFSVTTHLAFSYAATLLCLSIGYFFLSPSEDQFKREIDFSLTANKAQIFSTAIFQEAFSEHKLAPFAGEEYPLLHKPDYPDVLSPYFRQINRPPNIVFIMVEGLGGTLMPPYDSYGGFTPYLDSLASQSLYWTHFLSTSGRSFNAQPSILASLPYGEQGFMEMGYMAPSHHSLISILNDNHYKTSYFGGYESRFDKLDQFLERQQMDLLMDASRFTNEYKKMDEIEGGFTWGYSDKDTYRRAFDFIGQYDQQTPRLDIFFTLNFHEPFIIQDPELYRQKFRERLDTINPNASKRAEFEQYEDIFMALLYTDDAIQELIDRYRKRADFDKTIFIITGDHRLIPIPHRNRIDRYYVPLLIYSPLLTEAAKFEGVSSHLDITPSILRYLEKNYQITQPDPAHWMGRELNTSREFIADRSVPLMRNKNQMPDYLSENYYLSGNQLFELEKGFNLRPVNNLEIMDRVRLEFENFQSINHYVTSNDKIVRLSEEELANKAQIKKEAEYFKAQQLHELNVEELYYRARELALSNQYDDARMILHRVLRERPNFHDARLLYGRTYGWEGGYDKAESEYNEVIRRNPRVSDAYSAKADLYFWKGEPAETILIADEAISILGNVEDLLFRRARAYWQKGDQNLALELTENALNKYPDNADLITLRERL